VRKLKRAQFAATVRAVEGLDREGLEQLLRHQLPLWIKARACLASLAAAAHWNSLLLAVAMLLAGFQYLHGCGSAPNWHLHTGPRHAQPPTRRCPSACLQFADWERGAHLQSFVTLAWPTFNRMICRCACFMICGCCRKF
jgi:hypothetical protein